MHPTLNNPGYPLRSAERSARRGHATDCGPRACDFEKRVEGPVQDQFNVLVRPAGRAAETRGEQHFGPRFFDAEMMITTESRTAPPRRVAPLEIQFRKQDAQRLAIAATHEIFVADSLQTTPASRRMSFSML